MAIITISRQFGAGGKTLGGRLATRLSYRYVDEGMIQDVAVKAKVSPEGVAGFEGHAGGRLTRLLDRMVSRDFIDRLLAGQKGYLDERRYVSLVREIIEELYEEDRAIIIGRGGQYILAGRDEALHVLLVADKEVRARFLMETYKLSRTKAEEVLDRADQRRRSFLRLFGSDPDDPLLYHLTINTGLVSLERAEEMVVKLFA